MFVYVCMYECMCMYVIRHVCMILRMNLCMYVCNPYKCIRMYVYVRVYVCVCIYICMHVQKSLSVLICVYDTSNFCPT